MKTLGLLALGLLTASCLIAESPAEFPVQPEQRPTIVQALTVPTTSKVLGSLPTEFLVPVKLLNPQKTFEWQVFLDFDPLEENQDARAVARGTSTPGMEDLDPTSPLYGLRRIGFSLQSSAPDPSICHTIEIIVATEFVSGGARAAHSVDPLDSDSVTWLYSPGGDLAGCPVSDASVPAFDPDAGVLQSEGQSAR